MAAPEPGGDRPHDEALLLAFVRGRDVPCPRCGYNLRELSAPVCPECREPLALSVGFRRPNVLWFVAAIAPGIFSGIAAVLMAVPLFGSLLVSPDPPAPWPIWATNAFGWLSGLGALALLRFRFAFLRQGVARQRAWAFGLWTIHVAAFAALITWAALP